MKFIYKKYYGDTQEKTRLVVPYLLKEFKNRWYLLSKEVETSKMKIFSLDRMSFLEITKEKFISNEDFDSKIYFEDYFGITTGFKNPKVEEIEISFNHNYGNYIKSSPIHKSQKILVDNKEELRIKLNLVINQDFINELYSYHHHLKIIKPQSLIDWYLEGVRNIINKY